MRVDRRGARWRSWITRGDDNAVEVTTATVARAARCNHWSPPRARSWRRGTRTSAPTRWAGVVALTVKEGDRVTAGQVLARLDPIQAAAAADGADAALQRARDRHAVGGRAGARHGSAARRGALAQRRGRGRPGARAAIARRRTAARPPSSIASPPTAAAARAQEASAASAVEKNELSRTSSQRRVEQARAERARVRDQLSKTTITAPISGTITRLDVELGEMVVMGVQNQPGTILMTISDLSTINAEVKVAEADVMRLAVGQPASVTLEALTGQRFAGRVIEIGASALPQIGAQSAREFRVKIELDRSDIPLRPGLTCDAEIVAADKRNILVVPLQAVVGSRRQARRVCGRRRSRAVHAGHDRHHRRLADRDRGRCRGHRDRRPVRSRRCAISRTARRSAATRHGANRRCAKPSSRRRARCGRIRCDRRSAPSPSPLRWRQSSASVPRSMASAATPKQTTARTFGSDTFLIAQVASPGRVSRRELREQLARNPPITPARCCAAHAPAGEPHDLRAQRADARRRGARQPARRGRARSPAPRRRSR